MPKSNVATEMEETINDTYKKLDEECDIVLTKIRARKKRRVKKEVIGGKR